MPKSSNPEECMEAAKSLLAEAVAHRQWCIPPKAVVQLPLGPFVEFEVTEIALDGFTEVHFVGKTATGEIFPILIEPAEGFICIYHSDVHETSFSDIKAALFLPLAAVLRDFWVAEQRASIFSAKSRSSGSPRLSGNPPEERIVYLPRILYSDKANLGRLSQDLPTLPRSAHQVRAHTRKVNNPNPNQIALAALFNVSVQIGHTFVRPHQRGVTETMIRYRSRSALRCLYEAVDPSSSSGSANWFLFEKKVKDWLASLGYEAIHTSASRNGDNGVDVSASWKSGGTERLLVAQCKCYRADRPVGPSVVRELIGSLAACPAGTQGIIATTSYATEGAQALASEHNILIVTGDDWVITDGSLSRNNETLGDVDS
jgi:hypothetical protein